MTTPDKAKKLLIEMVMQSGLFSVGDEYFTHSGCDYCSPGFGNTVVDVRGYRSLTDAHRDREGNLLEFRLCGECLNRLYYWVRDADD